ncbi:hypothetical protein WBJ53_20315 [Spirosoma sp. SC4-14]|uniref:hypothetical protein n=1 Tax=Spirosoma sp. SC4-14 TaxID=3128900 RepID=UPI0030CEDA0A
MNNSLLTTANFLIEEKSLTIASQITAQSVASIKQINRLVSSMLMACLHRQLQTNIGKGLVQSILQKHALQVGDISEINRINAADITTFIAEGNRLFSTILPGKKSAVLRIVGHYARLSFSEIDPVVGLCAYSLFSKLALDLSKQNDITTLMLPFENLAELAPELTYKDYIAIGAYSMLSFPRPVPVIVSVA